MLERWPEIKVDIHEFFYVDLDDPGQCQGKSWAWTMSRVEGLLTTPCRLITPSGKPRPANRLQASYWPES